jgi:hypothetical protein
LHSSKKPHVHVAGLLDWLLTAKTLFRPHVDLQSISWLESEKHREAWTPSDLGDGASYIPGTNCSNVLLNTL